jgi:hypothetical protein
MLLLWLLHGADLLFNAFEFSFEMFLIMGQAKQRLIFAYTAATAVRGVHSGPWGGLEGALVGFSSICTAHDNPSFWLSF